MIKQLYQTTFRHLIQVELVHDPLCEVTAASLAEDGALGPELHASLEAVLGTSVL